MKINPLLLLLFLSVQSLFSQNFDLSILTVPDSLTKNANAVVRYFDTNIELVSQRKMLIKINKAVTILNEKGKSNAELVFHYDKSTKIKKIKIHIYNQFGIKIKDIKSKEIIDHSAADGISLFNDGRLKYYKHIPVFYPYTIVYEHETESSNTAFIPRWLPIGSFHKSIQHSTYSFTYPSTITIQKNEKNFDDYSITNNSSNSKLSYQIDNVKAINYEESSPNFLNFAPHLKLASNKFHLAGVDGQANTWKEFGKWMYDNLIASRMELPEATKLKVKQLVNGVEDPIEKAKIIYDFVQKKTRYISVQVGIGGWMPMYASDVDKLSYGDCKALTNYTKTLLDAVDVESYYTAVYAGEEKRSMENDVVSVQGNHAFLYVPSKRKDYWLECTSQKVPFGYQGTFTDDRNVLVIKPTGGEIKHTGIHNDKDSFQKTKATYTINSDGSIEGKVTILTAGIQYDDHFRLEKKDKRKISEYYKDKYWSHINNLELLNYNFFNNKDSIIFKEELSIKATDYASFSGNRMLFTINAFNRSRYVPKRYRSRKHPLEISRGFLDTDEFEVVLPDNYTIEAMPSNINIENKFGNYQFSVKKLGTNKLLYKRAYFLKKGLHQKSAYKEYRSFLKKIAKHDNSKIVLIKK